MKKFIAMLLSVCMLVVQPGCYSSKTLVVDHPSEKMTRKNYLILHTPTKIYKLHNYRFKGDILTGQLGKYSKPDGRTLHVYTQKEFFRELTQQSRPTITIKQWDIEKMTAQRHPKRSTLLITIVLLLALSFFAVDANKGTGWVNH